MPKRIVDGEALWGSQKLRAIEPEWIRAEYANLLPLATANGTFELDVDLIWARVYAANRPSITKAKVLAILTEFQRVKLLFPFTVENKQWGYWVGIDAPGRLPPPIRRGSHEKCGPDVPMDALREFSGEASDVASQWIANGLQNKSQMTENTTDSVGNPTASQRLASRARPRAPEPKPNPNPIPTPKPSSVEVSTYEIPDWVPGEEWLAFVEMRRAIHKPLATKHAIEYAIKKLDRLRASGQDPGAVLRQSVLASWQGLFEVSEGKNGTRKTFTQQRTENNRRALDEYKRALADRYRGEPDTAGRGDGPGAVAGGAGADGRGSGGPGT